MSSRLMNHVRALKEEINILKEKTHPAMRPWDELPKEYRRLPESSDKELLDFYSANISKF